MDESSIDRCPHPPVTPVIGDDPDGGQVIGPHGESPEDPAARTLQRGCLLMFLAIGIVAGVAAVLYRMFVAP